MANAKVTDLPVAISIDGSEYAEIVQAGTSKRVTLQLIGNLASGFVPTSTQVIAGDALNGGGPLSGDVTLNVDFEAPGAFGVIDNLPEISPTPPDPLADYFVVSDASGAVVRKVNSSSIGLSLGNMPAGGTTGQAVVKLSATNYDANWGTLGVAGGGTGHNTYAVGDILFASTTSALSRLADVATGNALISGGVGVAPSWGKIGLSTHVSGTLPVANGGTGLTDGTSGGILAFTATGTLASSAELTANQIVLGGGAGVAPGPLGSLGTASTVLHGNAGGAPSFAQVDLTTTVTGVLPIANGGTGGSSATTAFNTFAPTTTRGDLITRDATNNVRLPIGGANTLLASDGTDPSWANAATVKGILGLPTSSTDNAVVRFDGTGGNFQTSGVTVDDSDNLSGVNNVTGADANFVTGTAGANGNLAQWNADGDIVDSGAAASDFLTSSDIGTTVQGYDASLADLAGITFAQGDVIYFDGTNLVRLPAGTSGNVLQTNGVGANPSWAAAGTGDLVAANNLSDVANAATSFDNIKQAATDSYTGVVELATGAEVNAKTSGKAVTADVAFNPLVPVAITSSATPGVDLSSSRKFTLTFDESFTLQLPTSCVVGDEFVIHFTEGSGSGVTAAFASGYVGPDGALPDINTGAGERTRIHFEVTAQTGGTATEVLAVAAGGLWGAP